MSIGNRTLQTTPDAAACVVLTSKFVSWIHKDLPYCDSMPKLNTATVSAAVTPTVLLTLFSHVRPSHFIAFLYAL